MMKIPFVTWIVFSQIVTGCAADGERLANAFWWLMSHPALAIAILAALTPILALIPVVGAPIAAVWTKILTVLVPVIRELAEAYKEDTRPAKEIEKEVERVIVNDGSTKIGNIPGTRILARIAARRIAKRRKR
ncbi:MAG: hypothetical protein D6816_17090 [Bacteroidetes bacterium]|nr:MAG: hypothetical protein D6816_17090 [Bacteroidota bacterium]